MLEQNAYVKDLQEAYQRAKLYGTAEEAREIGKQLGVAKAERTIQNKYYKEMVEETTRKLANVNKTALAYINDEMPWVYATNYNEAANTARKVGMAFNLVDESTVRRMIIDDDITLPPKKLSIPKDMRWNTKQLNSAVLQGIFNGESMQKIADRILPIVDNNQKAAIRNARTLTTGAQNRGRLDSYNRLDQMGLVQKKVWMATHDERTRESHAWLDGEKVDIDKEFSNGLMFPGDTNGPPEEVYNCRCTVVDEVIGFRKPDGRIEYVDIEHYEPDYEYEQLAGKTKEEVAQPKKEIAPEPSVAKEPLPELEKLKMAMPESDYKEYFDILDNNEYVREAYRLYGNDVSKVVENPRNAYYQPSTKEVNYKYAKYPDQNKYGTLAHEYGHAIDDIARNGFTGTTFREIDKINDATRDDIWGTEFFRKKPSSSDQYISALNLDKTILEAALRSEEALREIRSTNASAGLQDMADGLFATQSGNLAYLKWGHGNRYYDRTYNKIKDWRKEKDLKAAYKELGYDASNQEKVRWITRQYETSSELWANQMSALTVGGKELEFMEKYAPNTLSVIKGFLKEVKK